MGNMIKINIDEVCSYVASVVKNVPGIAGAYLFGSALQGKVRPESDIDIGLVPEKDSLSERETDFMESEVCNLLQQFRGHPFDVVTLTMNSNNIIFCFRVIKEGRLIYARNIDRIQDFMEHVSRRYAEVYPRYKQALEEIIEEVISPGN